MMCGARLFVVLLLAASAAAQSNSLDEVLSGLREHPLNPVLLRQVKASVTNVPESELRCRLGVLYALGSFAAGNLEEGFAARAALSRAFPGNDLLQDLADARLSAPCGDCEGGSVLDPCRTCNGTGRCQACKGTGQQEVGGLGTEMRRVKCMHCSNHPGKCKTCAGSRGVQKPCPNCRGTALVFSAARADVLYRRLLRAMAPEGREPVILVVTAAPPETVTEDPAVARAAQVERAVAAAKAQAAGVPLLQKYGLGAEDVRTLTNPDLSPEQRSAAAAALAQRGLAHPTRGRYFFLPVPAGLTFCVADVVKNPYGGYYLKLTSTPPVKKKGSEVMLTPREVLEETARTICAPMGGFLSDPTVCVPDGDFKTGQLRKGEVVETGAWLIPVGLTQWGALEKGGACYRSADELLGQLGFSR